MLYIPIPEMAVIASARPPLLLADGSRYNSVTSRSLSFILRGNFCMSIYEMTPLDEPKRRSDPAVSYEVMELENSWDCQ